MIDTDSKYDILTVFPALHFVAFLAIEDEHCLLQNSNINNNNNKMVPASGLCTYKYTECNSL